MTVLERPYHFLYPFVFQWRGTWFMMPESSKASRIEVFSARQFPWEWTPEAVLFDSLQAVDSTLVPWKGGGGSLRMCRRIRQSATMTSSTRFTPRLRLARGRPTVEIP